MTQVIVQDPEEALEDVKRGLFLPVQHTFKAIADRVTEVQPTDYFGYHVSDLLAYLPFYWARPFLRPHANAHEWNTAYPLKLPPLATAKRMLPRMWFAANNHHALGVLQSMEHLKALFWLGGFSKGFSEHFDDYEYYGKPQLILASEVLNYDWSDKIIGDDGVWLINEGLSLSENTRVSTIESCIGIADHYRKEKG